MRVTKDGPCISPRYMGDFQELGAFSGVLILVVVVHWGLF